MANEYADIAELKAALELSEESFADPDITRALAAASRGIDNVAHRRFWLDEDSTQERFYTAEDCREIRVDDVVDVAEVATSPNGDGQFTDVWTPSTDYVLEPLNAAADGWPYTRVRTHPTGSFPFPTRYPGAVRVTGQFGWAAVPDGVKEATMILASKLLRRTREAPFGVVTFGLDTGTAMRVARNDPDVMWLLAAYIRNPVAVA